MKYSSVSPMIEFLREFLRDPLKDTDNIRAYQDHCNLVIANIMPISPDADTR